MNNNSLHLWQMLDIWTPLHSDITKIIDTMFWEMTVLEQRRDHQYRRYKRELLHQLNQQIYQYNDDSTEFPWYIENFAQHQGLRPPNT